MHHRLKSLSLATATLLLSLTSLLPLTLKFEPLLVQAQTIEQLEPGAEEWFLEAYELFLKGDYPATLEKLQQDLARFRQESDRASWRCSRLYWQSLYQHWTAYPSSRVL